MRRMRTPARLCPLQRMRPPAHTHAPAPRVTLSRQFLTSTPSFSRPPPNTKQHQTTIPAAPPPHPTLPPTHAQARSACPLCNKEWEFAKIEKILPSGSSTVE